MALSRLKERVAEGRGLFQGLLPVFLFVLFVNSSKAQITVVSSNAATNQFSASFTEDFNTLRSSGSATWTNNVTLRGWYVSYNNSSNLTLQTANATSGQLASYGSGAERAFGGCPGSATPIYLAFRIVNGATNTLTGLNLVYDLEKTGTGNVSVTLAYQIFNAGAGSVTSGTWTTLTTASSAGTGLSSVLANLSVPAGKEIWLRWQMSRTSGSATVMAIDNLSLSSLTWASPSVAPIIQQQPVSLTTEDGGAATFSVQASGSPSPSFQWRFNGSNLAGATNSTLVIDPAGSADAGNYDVVVANSAGSLTSSTATLSIRAASPSIIPAGGIFTNSATVTLLTSTAGVTIRYTLDGSTPSSTNGLTYSAPFALTQSATLRAVAGGTGLVDSSVASATFEIFRAPVLTSGPSAQIVLDGGTASFSVSATGNPAPTYQWRKGGVDLPGATNTLLLIQPVGPESGGNYDVVVSNAYGFLVTDPATLSVQARLPTLSPDPGAYSNSVIVTLASPTTGSILRYTLDGSTPSSTNGLIYSAPLGFTNGTNNLKVVATGSGLIDSSVTSGSYTVIPAPVFGGGIQLAAAGTATSSRSVPIDGIYTQAFEGLVSSGSAAWNDDLSSNATVVGWSANRTNYSFSSTTTTANGLYSSGASTNRWLGATPTAGGGPIHAGLRLVNRSGSTVQGLKVIYDAKWLSSAGSNTIILLQKKFTAGQGSLTNLPATNGNSADPISDYNGWTETGRIFGLASNTANVTYNLNSLSWVDGEELWLAWIFVKAGGTTTLVGMDNIRVQEFTTGSSVPPAAPTATPAAGTYTGNQTITLSTTTAGASIRYTTNGTTPSAIAGTAYSAPFVLSNSVTMKAVAYLADQTESGVSSFAYVIQALTNSAPVFVTPPVAQTAVEGSAVSLTATVSGQPTPVLQWSKNGTNIVGATNSTLAFTNVSASQAGTYQLRATNSLGSTSAVAALTVRAATPVFSPSGGTFYGGTNVTLSCTTSNALIRYTADGTDPSTNSGILYSNAVAVTETTILKAVSYRADLTTSPVATASFTVSTSTANPDDFLSQRFTGVTTNSGILFHTTNNYKGSTANLYVDIYQPAGDTATNRPVVMLIHGGGFRTSGVRTQSYIVTFANEFARRGYVAMSIDYRQRSGTDMPTSADELPALKDAAADALTALKWIRDAGRAATYGYDPSLIFIAGGSAGGRITTALACRETGDMGGLPTTDPYSTLTPPSSVTSDANAVYDRTGCIAGAVLWGGPEPEYRCYTVDSADLPCILIHGTYDVTLQTEGSPVLYRALIEAGVPAQLNLLNGYDHSLGTTSTASQDAKPQAAAWMAEFFVQEWKRKFSGSTVIDPVHGVTCRPGDSLDLQAPIHTTNGPTLSWRKDGVTLAGMTNAALNFSSISLGDAGRYEAVISAPLNSWSASALSSVEVGNGQLSSVSYDSGANSYSHPVEMVVAVADVTVVPFGSAFYVDPVNGNDAFAGTSTNQPWKTLNRVNSTTFQPGDVINFKAGGTWLGTLRPLGSGTAANPILIDSYGTGAKPVIDGNGVVESGTNYGGAIHLHNQSYWEIQNLEARNDATTDGLRRGIHVTASNYGVMQHIHIRNCTIQKIRGRLSTSDGDIQSKRTGGIIVETLDDASVPTRFHDVLIESNVITTVRNQGIVAAGNRINMSDYPNTAAWHARKATQLVIRGNTISDVTKNALILRLADSTGLVERNVCFNTATLDTGNTMFTASCDGSVFQYNEGYSNNATARDGSLYDADLRSTGIIFQYSYSHDNGHGLFWQYPSASGPNSNIIVRYNVSRNDRGNIFAFSGDAGGASTTLIHNNVVYLPAGSTNLIIDARSGNHTYTFANNIFYLEGQGVAYDTAGHAATFDSNVFYGAHPSSEPADARKITGDPKLVSPGSGGNGLSTLAGYQLQSGSPCIKTGTTTYVPSPGPYDLFGNSISLSTGLDIGVHQSSYSPPISGPSFSTSFAGQTADSDADGDGVAALVEYLLGGSSAGNDAAKLPQPVLQGSMLSLTVVERVNDSKMTTVGEASGDLTSWSSSGVDRNLDPDQTGVPAGFARATYSVSVGSTSKSFIRIRVNLLP